MTTLLQLCHKYFNTGNLYEVLNTKKDATDKEVRKAYYVLSMKYHPDKVTENEKTGATEKFKVISRIHALLNNADKRKLYDDGDSYNTTATMDDVSIIGSLTKIKVHSLKRKAPSSVDSKLKQKRFKSDDTCSELSMTTSEAYGIKKVTDDFDLEDYQPLNQSIEKPIEFIPLDTSQLNRNNGVLFSEDLNDDYEVWTLQCPDDININNLLSKSISFNELRKLEIKNTMSDKVDLIPYRSQEGTNITIVTPSEKTSNLSLNVVPLAGTLIMCNRIKKEKLSSNRLLPVDTIEDATRRRSELMSKITKRLSNKYDIDAIIDKDLKQEFKMEKESPKKIKKNKKKLINK